MILKIPSATIKTLAERLTKANSVEVSSRTEEHASLINNSKFITKILHDLSSYMHSRNDKISIDTHAFPPSLAPILIDILKNSRGLNGKNTLIRQLQTWLNLLDNPAGAIVKDIRALADALKHYIASSERMWVYIRNYSGGFSPVVVTSIKFVEEDTRKDYYRPAHVTLEYEFNFMGDKQNSKIHFHSSDLVGGEVTCQLLLDRRDMYLQNSVLDTSYLEEVSKYQSWKTHTGMQFNGLGSGIPVERWYRSDNNVPLTHEGDPIKLVLDSCEGYEKILRSSSRIRADVIGNIVEDEFGDDVIVDDDIADDGIVVLPVWPYLLMFSMHDHTFYRVHVNDMIPYVFDSSLKDKLILPENHKELIEILVEGTEDLMEDIVRGKTGGIIIVATGIPGVGKTLTAEVYSEVVKRPLYIVQASQLGIDINNLEINLKEVLERAVRWRAILLIDECDVYVRTRGESIKQNAVVGIFLRVLEYYKGILFMTSNRGTVIDDAILSRATAHIRYEAPDASAKLIIWKNLLRQFKLDMSEEDILECLESPRLRNITGRDIKSILKLAGLMSRRRQIPLDEELISFAASYQDFNKEDTPGYTRVKI